MLRWVVGDTSGDAYKFFVPKAMRIIISKDVDIFKMRCGDIAKPDMALEIYDEAEEAD